MWKSEFRALADFVWRGKPASKQGRSEIKSNGQSGEIEFLWSPKICLLPALSPSIHLFSANTKGFRVGRHGISEFVSSLVKWEKGHEDI